MISLGFYRPARDFSSGVLKHSKRCSRDKDPREVVLKWLWKDFEMEALQGRKEGEGWWKNFRILALIPC